MRAKAEISCQMNEYLGVVLQLSVKYPRPKDNKQNMVGVITESLFIA